MIDFNKQLNTKDIIKIIIPAIFIIASLVLFFLFIKPLTKENDDLKREISVRKENINTEKSYLESSQKDDFIIEDINLYDKFIDNITDLLINKKYIAGTVLHDKLDSTENLFPCTVNTKLLLDNLEDLKYISDDLNYNLISFYAVKSGDIWTVNLSNLFTMDKFYGLRDLYINNREDNNNLEEVKDKESKEIDDKSEDLGKKENESNSDNESKKKSSNSVIKNYSSFKKDADLEEKFIEYKLVDVSDENFLFAPHQEGINYDFNVKNLKNKDELIINAFNNSEDEGNLEIEFSKYNRIIWQSGGKIIFDFNSLGGEKPNLNLKFIDSHEKEIVIEPTFKDDKVVFNLSELQNYPIFLKSFIINLKSRNRRHFMISNGLLLLNQTDVNKASWKKKLFSAPSFNCHSVLELMNTYNNNHVENFLTNNDLNKNDYLTSPSYIFESKDAYEIFEKN